MGVTYWECYLSCLALCLFMVCYGMVSTYPSPAFPEINSGHYRFHLTTDMMSWLASFSGLFAIPGSIIMVVVMDNLGRKLAIIVATVPLAISWLLIICSSSVIPFAVGRALAGISLGMGNTCISVYVSELSPKQIRGTLNMLVYMHFNIGGFLINILALRLNWQWLGVVSLGLVSLTSLATPLLRESPRWLVSRGHREEAGEVIAHLWKIDEPKAIAKELDELLRANVRSPTSGFLTTFLGLLKPPLWRPLLLTQALFTFQMLTGMAYVTTYTISIFKESAGSGSGSDFLQVPNYQSCLIFLGNILGNFSSLFLIDRFGRKKLLMVSNVVIAVSLVGVGAFYYVLSVDQAFASRYLSWLPLCCLLVFVFSVSSCFIVIPQLLVGELFGLNDRAVASGVGSFTHNMTIFFVVKVFPHLTFIGTYGVFWVFAGCTSLSVVVVALWMPETKGMSLEDIQKMWYPQKEIPKLESPMESTRF